VSRYIEVRPKMAGGHDRPPGGKRSPTHSIQYGKKRFGSFRIVFIEIEAVTEVWRELGSEAGLPLKGCKPVAFSRLMCT
jgi:hypothetical protein